MKTVHTPCELVAELSRLRYECVDDAPRERLVGFVPTMGALHQGHMSLIHRMVAECDVGVVSIFVNPTQFGPGEDFERYPRTLEADLKLCEEAGVDLVYAPTVDQVYPEPFLTSVHVSGLTEDLEGAHRPGHFDGVCLVVAKLFALIRPHRAYFGEKDYQQLLIVRQLARNLDLGVEVVACPLIRDDDGLAASSRNRYLSPEERERALCLFRALTRAKELYEQGERSVERLEEAGRRVIRETPGVELDYFVVRRAGDLKPFPEGKVEGEGRVLGAIRVGETRLIDNMPLREPTIDTGTGG